MSDSPQYEAFVRFARAQIELDVLKATDPLKEEIRSLRSQLETRSAQTIEGPPGPAGKDGASGRDGTNGIDGKDGAPGAIGERGADGLRGMDGAPSTVPGPQGEKGERGTDGIGTREALDEWFEARVSDINVRTFADIYRGVYKAGETYARGALVTWDGSMWISKTETSAKPGLYADWQLVVKRGADGRK